MASVFEQDMDEKPPTSSHSTGYRRLADYMAWNPSAVIFHRFQAANALNLLGLQAEIARTEKELAGTAWADKTQQQSEHAVRHQYQVNWAALTDGEDGDSRQRQLVLQLRGLLRDYNTALVQQITMSKQPNPTQRDLGVLCNWLESPYGLASSLRGPAARLWFETEGGERRLADKMALWHDASGADDLSQFLLREMGKRGWSLPLIPVPERKSFPASDLAFANPSSDKDFRMFGTVKHFSGAADRVVTVVSCAVITLPIVALHFIKNASVRLGLIVAFSLLFALVLTFVSDASRKEIFVAVSAFAAVQVVFVGTAENVGD